MDVLILAAGYGTRLARDIAEDTSGRYAHLAEVPKPLLPIGALFLSVILLNQPRRSAVADALD
jgi:NDP-sugar pyrophosphorylase family protein